VGDDGILDLFTAAAERAEAESGEPPADGGALPSVPGDPPHEGAVAQSPPPRPAEPEPDVLSVSELNSAVRRVVEDAFAILWVGGEIGNWKRAGSGHCYFTLKDDRAEVRCVMWRGEASRLPMDPEDGMEVRLHAQPTVYEARGSYQLVVRKLEAAGEEGLWRLAFEKLRARLQEEGLLAPERKRALPRFPRTVGVVTSTTGAALRDILSVLQRRAPWTRVLVLGARMQGDGAAQEIAEAVRTLGSRPDVDVLIVGRGGGSMEDLWAFNEEPVARAIVDCPVPVVSAVGHEVDVTISDLVADLRAPTPSAAAEAVVRDGATLRRQLGEVQLRLRRALKASVDLRRRRIADAPRRLAQALQARTRPLELRVESVGVRLVRSTELLIAERRRRTQVLDRLERAMVGQIRRLRSDFGTVAGRLEALSPLATLKRGYAIPLDPDGGVLRRRTDFAEVDRFQLRVSDGRIACRVEDILDEEA
jgi:exodeoxyribonuclease VII large subunit